MAVVITHIEEKKEVKKGFRYTCGCGTTFVFELNDLNRTKSLETIYWLYCPTCKKKILFNWELLESKEIPYEEYLKECEEHNSK